MLGRGLGDRVFRRHGRDASGSGLHDRWRLFLTRGLFGGRLARRAFLRLCRLGGGLVLGLLGRCLFLCIISTLVLGWGSDVSSYLVR